MRRVAVLLLILALVGTPGLAADPAGRIGRLAGKAVVLRDGIEADLSEGTAIHARDVLVTRSGGRLEAVFADGTAVTLAESSNLAVDVGHFPPVGAEGRLFLRLVSGAVLVNAGRLAEGRESRLRLRTPVATVGIRGTRFWAGPLDDRFGILLLDGGVFVENTWGRVDLSEPGTGVVVPVPDEAARKEYWELAEGWTGPGAPPVRGGPLGRPEPWSADLVARALGAMAF